MALVGYKIDVTTLVTNVPTYTQFSLCISNVLLNVFGLIVSMNCYEAYSTLHGYDIGYDHHFLVVRTLKIETTVIKLVCFTILSFCHLLLLLWLNNSSQWLGNLNYPIG